jgi:hypothetical protein
MSPSTLLTIFAAAVLSSGLLAQGGRGADATATDAMAMLRSGPLSRGPGESPEIRPGMPDTFPRELLPAGAIPELSAVSPSLTVVVAALADGQPFDRSRFGWALEDLGWMSASGSAGVFSGASFPVQYCRGGDFASYQFRTTAGGGRLVRIALGKEPQRSCAPMGMRMFSDVPTPQLTLPDGLRSTGGGGGGSLDDMSGRARLETTMTIDALAAHFIPQFEEAGWTVESGPTSDGVMLVVRLLGASRAGDPVTAQLILTALPDTPYVDALARFVRHKPVRGR